MSEIRTHATADDAYPPDELGRFGEFGGRFVPETVMAALDELEAAMEVAFADPAFHAEQALLRRDFVGRPTPLYLAERLTEDIGGARIWLKREDLAHTGDHHHDWTRRAAPVRLGALAST